MPAGASACQAPAIQTDALQSKAGYSGVKAMALPFGKPSFNDAAKRDCVDEKQAKAARKKKQDHRL